MMSRVLLVAVVLALSISLVVGQKSRTRNRQAAESRKAIVKVDGPNGMQGTIKFECQVSVL